MKRYKRKMLAWVLAFAMVLTGTNLSGMAKQAKAAETGEDSIQTQADPVADSLLETPIDKFWTAADFPDDIDKTKLVGDKTITAYLQVTKSTPYSWVRFSAGMGPQSVCPDSTAENGNFSNKSLIGTLANDSDSAQGGGWYIHNGAGEDAGTGKGEMGTGIYKCNSANSNKATSVDDVAFRLRIMTKDTEARVIGIVFSSGISVSVAEDGTMTSGFNPADYTLEKTGLDATDEEQKSDEEIAAEKKQLLTDTVDTYKAIPENRYQAAEAKKLEDAIKAAEAVAGKEGATADELVKARTDLQTLRASLLYTDSGEPGNPRPFRELDTDAVTREMGAGINLGNTMDGHAGFTPDELTWQGGVKTKTSKALIKAWHDAGFNTVRIPVTWGTMIDTKNGYTIKESWINRVQEIVDYCVEQDMYCIINIHHDGAEQDGWLRVGAEDIDPVYEQFEGVWKNIANHFRDYDEHLIFESMNEVTDGDKSTRKEVQVLNNLNQIFVNVVRATGSNNTKRWLAFVGEYATGKTEGLVVPADAYNTTNHLMFAAHIYKATTNVKFTYSQIMEMDSSMNAMQKNGYGDIPMYIGEWGNRTYALEDAESGWNDQERACYSEIVHMAAQARGMCPIVWDTQCGLDDETGKLETGVYTFWERSENKPVFKSIIDAMMRGTFNTPSDKNEKFDYSDIYMSYGHASDSSTETAKAPEVTEITDITVDASVSMTVGEVKKLTATVAPEGSNDVVLWSTDNDKVATVYNGQLRAKGTGQTTVHAYSQSGSVKKDIQVFVGYDKSSKVTGINTDKETYSVKKNHTVTIKTSLIPEDSTDALTFESTNTDVVTVNDQGKLTGINDGNAYIIITASSGITKLVPVEVTPDVLYTDQVNVALHILYNDSSKKYYGTELSQPVAIQENGQYTVSFDLSKELSEAGKKVGITEINKLTAIYLKDYDITMQNTPDSIVSTAKLRYDKVVVNDTEMTITDSEWRNPLQEGSNVFDSGQPINAWDGSVVDGINASGGVASFKDITNPTKISVTFTIDDLTFKQITTVGREKPATAIETSGETQINMAEAGAAAEVAVNVTPTDTDTLVSFISSDTSIVSVDTSARPVGEDGSVKASITAVGEGTATITAITENGLQKTFTVVVGSGIKGGTSEPPAGGNTQAPPAGGNTQAPPAGGNTPAVQTVTVAGSVKKALGSKAFNIQAATNGDGALSYSSSDEKVATISSSGDVTIKAIGTTVITVKAAATAAFQEAQATCTLTVTPKKAAMSSAKALAGKKVKVKWKKNTEATGYEVSYSTDKKFKKGVKKVAISKVKTTSTTLKKLTAGKTYYVRVRAYKKVGSKKIYGAYSAAKKVKTKK